MGFTGKACEEEEEEQNHHHQQKQHQNRGMGFLFVFLPEDQQEGNSSSNYKKRFQQFGQFKRTNSSHFLLSRAQSTISICALLIFVTLLLFTLSTFEPSSAITTSRYPSQLIPRRRQLMGNGKFEKLKKFPTPKHALQGMGSLYRRGTKSMNELVVAHVVESLNLHELKLFLRLFFGSALNSRADLLFIFGSKSAPFDNVILEENDSFLKMVAEYEKLSSTRNSTNSTRNSEVPLFMKRSKNDKGNGEPIWGGKVRSFNFSGGGNQSNNTESTRLSYGSVVGFDVDELDPENSLAGFLDHVPMSLRRWACYPMLLGRLRRNFKHIVLADVKELVFVGDPLAGVRSSSPESVHLSMVTQSPTSRHGKRVNSDRAQSPSAHPKSVSPAILKGGARGIRRISQAMLNEIVRSTTTAQKKKKNSVTEFGVFNQLVGNEFLLKNVKLITSSESIPELSSLAGSNSKWKQPGSSPSSSSSQSVPSSFTVVRRGNSNFDVNSTVLKHILCSSPVQNSVYSNCL
ncbi:OLC1v1036793C1 [Oldenlandia corymbosa var. corymbosa]|uniref:OLC1v1036793C1 n=1 Tax=Oldenlandia corymbosa var. corymbosa TaxID=529605 RepID=A0AAV1CX20_OLDCO|nr:OLC1v1036793C1 [Oldenlandia corymbosa var. corymbosa]